jgi:hypothetical protein
MKRSCSPRFDKNDVPIEQASSPSVNFPEFPSVSHDHPKKAAKIPKISAAEFKYDVDGLPNKAAHHVITMPLDLELQSNGSSPSIALEVDLNFAAQEEELQSGCDSSSPTTQTIELESFADSS